MFFKNVFSIRFLLYFDYYLLTLGFVDFLSVHGLICKNRLLLLVT